MVIEAAGLVVVDLSSCLIIDASFTYDKLASSWGSLVESGLIKISEPVVELCDDGGDKAIGAVIN